MTAELTAEPVAEAIPEPVAEPTAEPKSFVAGWRDRWIALKKLPEALAMAWEASPQPVVWGTLLRIVSALIPLSLLAVTRNIIDAIGRGVPHAGAGQMQFWGLVVLECALAILSSVLTRVIDFCDTLVSDNFARHVSVRIMEHASQLDLARYEDPGFYDKLERAKVQATDHVGMIRALGFILQQAITAVTLAAGVFLFSPWLLLLLIICVVPAFVGESHFAFLGYNLKFQQTPVRRELDYLRTLGASKEAAKELKLFGLSSYLIGRYRALANEIFKQDVALARRRLAAGSLLVLVTTAGYYGAYAYVIYRTVTGSLSVGTLIFLAGAISGASINIQTIFSQISSVADQALFITDLIDFFKVVPRVQPQANALPAPRRITTGFEFERVSFAYPGNSKRVLERLSFRLEPRQRVALVGANGQGKTTIVKLMTRLYDPSQGRVLLDGVDLREYDPASLSCEIGVIFQDFMRYEMTAQENIAIGKIESRDRLPDIESAAEKSLADEIIRKLPGGYGQMLGRRFEGGVDLSGGEWQRLALARAYMRDAQLLVLDEPTASLDALAEFDIFQRFTALTSGKMALLISHRFSTVRMADTILVLADGKIAERGNHRDLVARGGLYSEMFELQASNYR
jgi:ATP-binding cassette subfamily B protein